LDALRLKNMVFFAHHGNKQPESELGQRFEVDVEFRGSLKMAAMSDDLSDSFDYERIYQLVSESVTSTRYNLIETLAEEICRRLLHEYNRAQVCVTVRKPNPPIAGVIEFVEVEITRGPIQDQALSPV